MSSRHDQRCWSIASALAVLMAGGCRPPAGAPPAAPATTSSSQRPQPAEPEAPQAPAENGAMLRPKLLAAPQAIDVAGRRITLETYLWRDFMPVAGDPARTGRPLMAVIKLKAASGTGFPADVDAQNVWLVRGDEVWAGTFLKEERPAYPDAVEKVFRNGPLWPAGQEVDVVVEVLDGRGGRQLLRAARQRIHQTS